MMIKRIVVVIHRIINDSRVVHRETAVQRMYELVAVVVDQERNINDRLAMLTTITR